MTMQATMMNVTMLGLRTAALLTFVIAGLDPAIHRLDE